MKAVLLLGGAPPPDAARAECQGAYVVAADSGALLAERWGLRPDAVVGDMDSVPPTLLAGYEAAGVRVERHPKDKDETDARLALDLVLAAGATEVVFLGATGRRVDHTFANMQLLRKAAESGAAVRAVEADARLVAVTPARPFAATLAKGTVVSVLALTDRAEGVTLEGLAFPLAKATLAATEPLGVSNAALGGRATVSCASGILLLVLPTTT